MKINLSNYFQLKKKMMLLQEIEMKSLECKDINQFSFSIFPNLIFLNLNKVSINFIHRNHFIKNSKLIKLIIQNCYLLSIELNSFKKLRELEELNMINTQINSFQILQTFQYFKNIRNIQTEYFYVCCYFVIEKPSNKLMECNPKESLILSCSDLLVSHLLRIFIWFLTIFGIIGNFTSIFFRVSNFKRKSHILHLILPFSDLMILFAFSILIYADKKYRSNFYLHHHEWKNHLLCKSSGMLASFSFINSMLCTNVISFERYLIVKNPFKIPFKNYVTLIFICLCIFLLSFFGSISPYILFKVIYLFL